jgi:hypothetical protein
MQRLRALGIAIMLGVAIYLGIMWNKTTAEGPCTYYPYPCHSGQ